MANDELDDLTKFEAPETAHTIPAGYLVLYFGLILWGIWYVWAYSPWGSGWTQAKDLEGTPSSGTNLFWTVAFTVIPTLFAVGIALAQKRKKKG
jgi:phosphotransferase system  glucose/maltose/N-acetylglucosamine-specific IIC component